MKEYGIKENGLVKNDHYESCEEAQDSIEWKERADEAFGLPPTKREIVVREVGEWRDLAGRLVVNPKQMPTEMRGEFPSNCNCGGKVWLDRTALPWTTVTRRKDGDSPFAGAAASLPGDTSCRAGNTHMEKSAAAPAFPIPNH